MPPSTLFSYLCRNRQAGDVGNENLPAYYRIKPVRSFVALRANLRVSERFQFMRNHKPDGKSRHVLRIPDPLSSR